MRETFEYRKKNDFSDPLVPLRLWPVGTLLRPYSYIFDTLWYLILVLLWLSSGIFVKDSLRYLFLTFDGGSWKTHLLPWRLEIRNQNASRFLNNYAQKNLIRKIRKPTKQNPIFMIVWSWLLILNSENRQILRTNRQGCLFIFRTPAIIFFFWKNC